MEFRKFILRGITRWNIPEVVSSKEFKEDVKESHDYWTGVNNKTIPTIVPTDDILPIKIGYDFFTHGGLDECEEICNLLANSMGKSDQIKVIKSYTTPYDYYECRVHVVFEKTDKFTEGGTLFCEKN